MLQRCALLLLILLVEKGHADKNEHFPFLKPYVSEATAGPNSSPKPKDPFHISDFTDPDTRVNPFLDIPEGRTEAFGRRVVKEENRPLPSPPEMNFHLVEGGPDDRAGRGHSSAAGVASSRWNSSSSGHARPPPARKPIDFTAFTEENPFDTREEYAENPVTSSSRAPEFDDVTSQPENTYLTTNALVGALVAGVGVAAAALAFVICWKKRYSVARTQRPTCDVERGDARNSDKQCAVDSPQGK